MSKELLQKGRLDKRAGGQLRKSLLKGTPGKGFAKGFAAVCAVVLAVTQFGPMETKAADDYETTYKVMIYSGDKGTFNGTGCVSGAGKASLQGADTIVVSGLHYGDTISINVSSTNGAINLTRRTAENTSQREPGGADVTTVRRLTRRTRPARAGSIQ